MICSRAMKTLLTFLFSTVLLTAGVRAQDTSTTLARARAHLGSEAALNSLKSVRYVGTLDTVAQTPEGPAPVQGRLEIVFQKPMRQRIMVTLPDRVEITALNDYEGWERIEDRSDASRWRLTLLPADRVKRLRANTWENLNFFGGLDSRGGRVNDLGIVQVAGQPAHKIAFVHAIDIAFIRHFDPATGKLVLTETESGGQIREEGEIRAGGIRFPRKVITLNRLPDGSTSEVTVTFEEVTVNETFPDQLFAVPMVGPR